jgi:D-sedoheptulose 7-phosphate isomerase
MIKNKTIKNLLNDQSKELTNILNVFLLQKNKNFNKLCLSSIKAIKNKKKIIFFGNGGSASDSQHLATELTVRFKKNRKALPGLALTTDTSALTAIGNDFGFENIYSRQIEALGRPGDICIAITTSGNSKNLIQAIKIANKKRLITFCFSGNNGGKIKKFTKFPIIIPSKNTALVQVLEIFIGQIYCNIIEDYFYTKNKK